MQQTQAQLDALWTIEDDGDGHRWRPVPGHDRYMISDEGRIHDIKLNRELEPYINDGYRVANLYDPDDGKEKNNYKLARWMASAWIPCDDPSLIEVDHKDRNRLNDTLANLRWVTESTNKKNRHKFGRGGEPTSQYRGVSWNKNRRKWHSRITIDGHKFHLGLFEHEEEAARHYDWCAESQPGEYQLNFGSPAVHYDEFDYSTIPATRKTLTVVTDEPAAKRACINANE
jgi:hypothetical protein